MDLSTHKRKPESPLVVVGSANADIYLEVARLPKSGETISAVSGDTLPGGKGANQAACAARLGHPTYFIGQVGRDSNAGLVREALSNSGVQLVHLAAVEHSPTGHAVVFLQPGGQNSIVIVGGANASWQGTNGKKENSQLVEGAKETVRTAGALLLQREIPESVNMEAAKIASTEGVPVILDAGGAEEPITDELLHYVDILSPNETELGRLTGLPIRSLEEVVGAAKELQKRGVKQVLVKLGEDGAILLDSDGTVLHQKAILAPKVVDTTGAGDTFTAAFGVCLVKGSTTAYAMEFAAAAASLCVRRKGAMPSMPTSEEVLNLLKQQKN